MAKVGDQQSEHQKPTENTPATIQQQGTALVHQDSTAHIAQMTKPADSASAGLPAASDVLDMDSVDDSKTTGKATDQQPPSKTTDVDSSSGKLQVTLGNNGSIEVKNIDSGSSQFGGDVKIAADGSFTATAPNGEQHSSGGPNSPPFRPAELAGIRAGAQSGGSISFAFDSDGTFKLGGNGPTQEIQKQDGGIELKSAGQGDVQINPDGSFTATSADGKTHKSTPQTAFTPQEMSQIKAAAAPGGDLELTFNPDGTFNLKDENPQQAQADKANAIEDQPSGITEQTLHDQTMKTLTAALAAPGPLDDDVVNGIVAEIRNSDQLGLSPDDLAQLDVEANQRATANSNNPAVFGQAAQVERAIDQELQATFRNDPEQLKVLRMQYNLPTKGG